VPAKAAWRVMKRVRVCVPSPHDFSHSPQAAHDDTVHEMGQGVVLQARLPRILDS
jgi:hypothetical protein